MTIKYFCRWTRSTWGSSTLAAINASHTSVSTYVAYELREFTHSFCSALVRLHLEYCTWFGALQHKKDMGMLEFSGGPPRWLRESGVHDVLLEIEQDDFVHHLSTFFTYLMRRCRWSQTVLEVHTSWRKCNEYKETPILRHWEVPDTKITCSTVNVTEILHLWL